MSADPCRLDINHSVADALGSPVRSAERKDGDYESWCEYRMENGTDARVEIFHASGPEYARALKDGTVWKGHDGAGEAAGFQDTELPHNGTLFYRAVQRDAGVDITVRVPGQSLDGGLRAADEIAADALAALDRLR